MTTLSIIIIFAAVAAFSIALARLGLSAILSVAGTAHQGNAQTPRHSQISSQGLMSAES